VAYFLVVVVGVVEVVLEQLVVEVLGILGLEEQVVMV